MKIDTSIIIAFLIYFGLVLAAGIYFYAKSRNMNDYFIGGRNLNSWVTALSAQASDMSGWLLMGLPAAAYMMGLSEIWLAIGLAIGTYANWKFVAKRLRKFTAASSDSITIPEYLQNRFLSNSKLVRLTCAAIIFIFFLIYTASAFNAGAKLFKYVFNIDYTVALTIGAVVIISYTFLGGFLAVCWTDFVQGILMFGAIIIVPILAFISTPDTSIESISLLNDGTYLNIFKNANGSIAITSILSSLAWALGYFGMPHILVRFMAIKSSDMIKKSRIIAMVWVLISLTASVAVGIFGYTYLTSQGITYASKGAAEIVFMDLVSKLTPGFIAGILLCAILAAVMSTADSQLLVTASTVANDFYKPILRPNASTKELMWVSRGAVIVISILAYILAFNPENSVMNLVSYAWAGFGAAFGPVIILSLFWKRMTISGAVAGMITGGAFILIWESLKLEASTGIYSLLPGFFVGAAAVVIASLLDKKPSKQVEELFERSKTTNI